MFCNYCGLKWEQVPQVADLTRFALRCPRCGDDDVWAGTKRAPLIDEVPYLT
jgi:hypothetical protein